MDGRHRHRGSRPRRWPRSSPAAPSPTSPARAPFGCAPTWQTWPTIGALADLHQPGTRLVGLTDRPRRRYARLALRDDRVVAAVLLGLPQAIATIGLLHRRAQRLPSDRLGLLLDLPHRPTSGDADANDDAQICLCNNVRKQTLLRAWRSGSHTVTALAEATRATTGLRRLPPGGGGTVRRLGT